MVRPPMRARHRFRRRVRRRRTPGPWGQLEGTGWPPSSVACSSCKGFTHTTFSLGLSATEVRKIFGADWECFFARYPGALEVEPAHSVTRRRLLLFDARAALRLWALG